MWKCLARPGFDTCRAMLCYCWQVFLVAEEEGWEPTPRLLSTALDPYRQVAGKEVVEDGFRILRAEETQRSGPRKEISHKRCWRALMDSAVESDVHRYTALDWRRESCPRGARLSSWRARAILEFSVGHWFCMGWKGWWHVGVIGRLWRGRGLEPLLVDLGSQRDAGELGVWRHVPGISSGRHTSGDGACVEGLLVLARA